MQSQTKTYNRGRNIVWGMWQRKPPMVIAGCSLLSFVSYRCYFSGADVLALIICCSAIVLCSCELQCARCLCSFLLCLNPPMLLQYAAMQLYFHRRRRNCLHYRRPHCHLYRRCRHCVLRRRYVRSFIFLVS